MYFTPLVRSFLIHFSSNCICKTITFYRQQYTEKICVYELKLKYNWLLTQCKTGRQCIFLAEQSEKPNINYSRLQICTILITCKLMSLGGEPNTMTNPFGLRDTFSAASWLHRQGSPSLADWLEFIPLEGSRAKRTSDTPQFAWKGPNWKWF